MRQFTRMQDLDACPIPSPVRAIVKQVLATELSISKTEVLDPDDGAVYLIEDGDNDRAIVQAIGHPLCRRPFEGVEYNSASRCFVGIFLRDNQCCITLIIPDQDWLSADWRQTLMACVEEDLS